MFLYYNQDQVLQHLVDEDETSNVIANRLPVPDSFLSGKKVAALDISRN